MINSLNGKLIVKEPTRIVIECCGVGYELFIPFSTYQELPDKNKTSPLLSPVRIPARSPAFTKISGIGKKKAERIVLELKDKIGDIQTTDKVISDSEEARKVLLALGYKEADIDKSLRKLASLRPGSDTETIVKFALKEL